MLPKDEKVIKRSEGDEGITTLKMRTEQYGYYYQFERNMLQFNQGNGSFIETGLISNIAATDWSWSALFADFDHDGNEDLFVSNGIPRRPNDLDYIKYVSNEQVANKMGMTKLVDEKALSLMPEGMVENYIFKGSGGYTFEDKSKSWLPNERTCSTATAIGDLDNDGDLDIVVNNVNDKPGIYINQTNTSANYLKLRLDFSKNNRFGIGTSVYSYADSVLQYKEMYTIRGFQASSEPLLNFGYGDSQLIDSIIVVWPNGMAQRLKQVKTNQTLSISYDKTAVTRFKRTVPKKQSIFTQIDPAEIGLDFIHEEDSYTDFDRLKLLPYQQSDKGPATAIGDINNDGKQDVFFGGSKRIPGRFYLQTEEGFAYTVFPVVQKDSIKEDVEAVIEDFNNDGKADLFIGTGGADFYGVARPLLDSYYLSADSGFELSEISDYYENASCVKPFDFDGDGDLDLFVGNESVSNDFGKMPKSYLLKNDNGKFRPIQKDLFENLGMVTDAIWEDYNNDGFKDLIVVGEWMNPIFLKNDKGTFRKDEKLSGNISGLYQSVIAFDIDGDGDKDYLLGNWGLNSKYKASQRYPMKMYYSDFDGNGQAETVIVIEKNGSYYPIDSFDMLAGQIVSLHKKFTSYESFAGKTIEEIFTSDQLRKAIVYEVTTLATGYLRNDGDKFSFQSFSNELQLSPVLAMLKYDFDKDGNEEILLGGNYFGVQPFNGRYGSFAGAIINNKGKVVSGNDVGLHFINLSVRHLNVISFSGTTYLLVTINNGPAQVYRLLK